MERVNIQVPETSVRFWEGFSLISYSFFYNAVESHCKDVHLTEVFSVSQLVCVGFVSVYVMPV